MKKAVILAAAMVFGSGSALASGYVCSTKNKDLNIKVYNHVKPELGTRNAAVMVVSDPAVKQGRKTIAVFRSVNGTLSNRSMTYNARVDLRFTEIKRKGEYISGTRLGQLKRIVVDVDDSFTSPLAHGAKTKGILVLTKRNGKKITRALACAKYLKSGARKAQQN